MIATSNLEVIQAITNLKHQSGQQYIELVYQVKGILQVYGNTIELRRTSAEVSNALREHAKSEAQRAVNQGILPEKGSPAAKSTVLKRALARWMRPPLPPHVGRFFMGLDQGLPGKHTRTIYDALNWKEARTLVQLRTGMARLNGYLQVQRSQTGVRAGQQ